MEKNLCSGGHTPELIKKIDKWKEGMRVGACRKGYTGIYQCAVCGFKWSEKKTFRDAFISGEWTWVEE